MVISPVHSRPGRDNQRRVPDLLNPKSRLAMFQKLTGSSTDRSCQTTPTLGIVPELGRQASFVRATSTTRSAREVLEAAVAEDMAPQSVTEKLLNTLKAGAVAASSMRSCLQKVRKGLATKDLQERARLGVKVESPAHRGMSAEQFYDFFQRFVGHIIEGAEGPGRPVCLPLLLAEMCVIHNRQAAKQAAEACKCNKCGKTNFIPLTTNLYAVNTLIIKPETEKACTSYAEQLNENGLPVDFFISHHWGEDFGEFTQSLLRHAMSRMVSHEHTWRDLAYWCCAFANNQHVVQLGDTLEQSPFYLALSSEHCHGTVMMLNKEASAMDRVWCIYEVFLTHQLKKDFVLNSVEGPLDEAASMSDAKDLWLKHYFQLLQNISVQHASSTSLEDYDKIMGEIKREKGGAEALNNIVKAILAGEALFTLSKRGEYKLVERALSLKADPDARDTRGVRPLTYAQGHNHELVVQLLLDWGADPLARVGAEHIVNLWSDSQIVCSRARAELKKLSKEAQAFHKATVETRESELQNMKARHMALLIYPDVQMNAELRLQAVQELAEYIYQKWRDQEVDDSPTEEDSDTQLLQFCTKLVPCLGDPDHRVRRAALDVFINLGELTESQWERFIVNENSINVDNLKKVCDEATQGTVLHLASHCRSTTALRVLCAGIEWKPELGKDLVGLQDAGGRTALHLLAAQDRGDCMQQLADKASLNKCRSLFKEPDHRAWTPLHHAATAGSVGCLKKIYTKGSLDIADLLGKTDDGLERMPVHLAAANKHQEFIVGLVRFCGLTPEALVEPDAALQNVVHIAAETRNVKLLRALVVECRVPKAAMQALDSWNRTPAHLAVLADAKEVIETMQELAIPTHHFMGPATTDMLEKTVALVQQRAGGGVDPMNRSTTSNFSRRGSGAGMGASQTINLVDKWKIGKVQNILRDGTMTIDYSSGNLESTRGAGQTERDVSLKRCIVGPTPRVLAAKLRREKALEALDTEWAWMPTLLGEDYEKEDALRAADGGELPVGYLISLGRVDLLEKVFAKKLAPLQSLNIQDSNGRTAVHRAAASGSPEVFQTVMRVGGFKSEDISVVDNKGWTPMHHCAASGNAESLRTILERYDSGVLDLATEGIWKRTPAHLAAVADAADVLSVILEFGGPMDLPMGNAKREEKCFALVYQGDDEENSPHSGAARSSARSQSPAWTQVGTEAPCQLKTGKEYWRLGVVSGYVLGLPGSELFTFLYEDGKREDKVQLARCAFAPTPFVLADRLGCENAAKILSLPWLKLADRLEVDADALLVRARQGATPLGELCATGDAGMILGARVPPRLVRESSDSLGRTALHRVASSANTQAIEKVLELGDKWDADDFRSTDLNGWNVIHYLAAFGEDQDHHGAALVANLKLLCKYLPPEDCALADNWQRTPAHLIVLAAGKAIKAVEREGEPAKVLEKAIASITKYACEGLRALASHKVNIDKPLGQKELKANQSVVFVKQHKKSRRQSSANAEHRDKKDHQNQDITKSLETDWFLARVMSFDQVEHGMTDITIVDDRGRKHFSVKENWFLAPTPFELAEKIPHCRNIALTLRELLREKEEKNVTRVGDDPPPPAPPARGSPPPREEEQHQHQHHHQRKPSRKPTATNMHGRTPSKQPSIAVRQHRQSVPVIQTPSKDGSGEPSSRVAGRRPSHSPSRRSRERLRASPEGSKDRLTSRSPSRNL
eukprot:TRINITY_DN4044_c0_g2_i1.p1 TRINITY_DN4044_c0_g2~~TRINITY_DN4044_c0_g2_i1.p1  ORF type:complete len:1919 (-),score=432.30 TRINITY_DN4044_c0_g2_i1:159-5264(-)